jgi:acetolactate synthase-1/2/3 large subunit
MLAEARRPVLLLGGGACDAGADAVALAETLDAPVACTINAKGLIPGDHPLALGSNQSFVPVRELVAAADVVLAIGTELGETDYDVVFDGQFRIDGKVIRVDIDPAQLHSNFLADVAILSDSTLAIRALLQQLPASKFKGTDSPGAMRAAAVRRELVKQWPEGWSAQRRVLDVVQATLPDVVIAGDSTQPVYSGNHLYEPHRTRSWFNSSTGYGTLGYGLPAAIGAKIAMPGRPVIALIGDGGLQFTLPELASAVEAKAGVIVLLWNNYGYGEIKRYMDNRGIPQIGVDIYTPDLLAAARALGCDAERATSFEHLAELLQRGAHADRPTVVELLETADFLTAAR